MQWLFDYFGDRKNNPDKIYVGFWSILSTTWRALSDDQDTLSRIYLSHNFVNTLTETFTQATIQLEDEKKIQNLVDAVVHAIEALDQSNLWFKIRMDYCIALILSYTKLIIHTQRDLKVSISYDELSALLSKILKSTLSSSSDVKKLSSVFNSKVLIEVFVALGLEVSGETLVLFKTLISTLIATADDKSVELDLKPITDSLESYKLSDDEKEKSIITFYEILVDSWPAKSANAFSQLRVILPSALKSLVSISSDKKIKLDSDFLESTMSQIFIDGENQQQNIDWELLLFIHNIEESFLTERKWLTKILSAPSGQQNSEQFESFAETLIDYFTNSRELPQFILSWKRDLDTSVWNSEFISEYLSTKVRSLSNIQLKSLLNALVSPLKSDEIPSSPEQVYLPIIVCVLSFFQQRTLPNATLFDPLFTVLQSTKFSNSSVFWDLKYLILSISSGFVTKFSNDIILQAEEVKYGLKEGDDALASSIMQALFRIAEYSQFSKFGKYTSKLLKYIGKKSKDSSVFFNIICDRWLLLVNTKFSKKHKEKLVSLFATNKDAFNRICSTELFYEQDSLSPLVLDKIGEKEELVREITRIKIIAEMPLPIIKISKRRKIIQNLTEMIVSGEKKKSKKSKKNIADSLELQLVIRAALDHLLSHPTPSVSLVSDVATFREYFKSSTNFNSHELDTYTRHTCENILKYHNKTQSKTELSSKFLRELVDKEMAHLKKESRELSDLDFVTIIVSLVDAELLQSAKKHSTSLDQIVVEQLGAILENTKKDAVKGTSKSLNEALHAVQNLSTLLMTKTEQLLNLNDTLKISGSYLTYAVTKLIDGASDSEETKILRHLAKYCFSVLAHISSSKTEIENVLASYIVLLELGVELDSNDVVFCIKKLEEQEFGDLLRASVSITFSTLGKNASSPPFACIKVIESFLRSLKDEENVVASQSLTSLITQVLENSSSLTERDFFAYLSLIEFVVKDRSRLVIPFALEIIISTFVRFCTTQFSPKFTPVSNSPDEVYTRLAEVASSTVVFNRSRLTGKYHILTQLLTALLGCLSNYSVSIPSNKKVTSSAPSTQSNFNPVWATSCSAPFSEKSGEAFTRLIANISSSSVSFKETNEKLRLTSYAQTLRRHLSMHIGVVLINYIRFSLQEGFPGPVRRGLVPGFYMVFNTIGQDQLKNVNLQLDANSRPYFKTLYDDYMAHGKWRSD